jgi:nucleoside 2-deoxyribosyltransferase
MRRDYRGTEDQNVDEIADADIADIRHSDFVLVNATRPSWGTAMEIVYAYRMSKKIAAFVEGDRVSPWLRFHCSVHPSMKEAIAEINAWSEDRSDKVVKIYPKNDEFARAMWREAAA